MIGFFMKASTSFPNMNVRFYSLQFLNLFWKVFKNPCPNDFFSLLCC